MKTKFWLSCVLAAAVISLSGCKGRPEPVERQRGEMSVKTETFGQTPDGKQIDLYTLTNSNGLKARITNYGAILVSLDVPARNGDLADIILGYDTLAGYVADTAYMGATVGRYANRIGKAMFVLEDVEYNLAANDGKNHLHGGEKGFNKVVWDAKPVKTEDGVGVTLSYLSKHGEEGYPGNLACTVTYLLTEDDELRISFEARTDKATPVNLTHHSYFNLSGQGAGTILGHELTILADQYTPTDANLIPSGEIKSVKGTPLDFTKPVAIGSRISQVPGGYDLNYVLNSGGGSLALAARVHEPTSGRVMEVYTTEPGIQFYSGNFLDGSITGKAGEVYKKYYGFCLEPQRFPDSPNKPNFPTAILTPGEKYTHEIVYKFSAN
jgi:aldose 1-epimerase